MRDLNYELKQLCERNRDGSYTTAYGQEQIVALVADKLHKLSFRDLRAESLKRKHVEAPARALEARE